jgi:cobalt-zinc-cadmium efflux system protein
MSAQRLDHAHPAGLPDRAFALGVALNATYVVIEGVVGLYANSVAVLADTGHNLSDVLALLLAWGAGALARRKSSERFTYGLGSTTIWAALINAVVLLIAVGSIAWEAIGRLVQPATTQPVWIIVVAIAGVFVNATTAALFFRGRQRDLNIRGAYLHMAADAAVSLGVVVAGAAIYWTRWFWIDPAISLVIAAVILASTWGVPGASSSQPAGCGSIRR